MYAYKYSILLAKHVHHMSVCLKRSTAKALLFFLLFRVTGVHFLLLSWNQSQLRAGYFPFQVQHKGIYGWS